MNEISETLGSIFLKHSYRKTFALLLSYHLVNALSTEQYISTTLNIDNLHKVIINSRLYTVTHCPTAVVVKVLDFKPVIFGFIG